MTSSLLAASILSALMAASALARSAPHEDPALAAGKTKAVSSARKLGSPKSRKGGLFRIGLRSAPITLNPLAARDLFVDKAMWWIAEPLLARNPDTYELEPSLAESYEAAPDGRTFLFTLRKGVQFHPYGGGQPVALTAEDVRFSFDAHRMGLYPTGARLAEIADFESIETAGPDRVRIRMKARLSSNLHRIASFPIVPKQIYERPRPGLSQTAIGTGPYRVKALRSGDRLVLERNPAWWGYALPENSWKHNFDEIAIRFLPDPQRELQMIQARELDWIELSAENYLRASADGSRNSNALIGEASPLEGAAWQHSLFLKLADPIFSDLKTRKSLQALLDREGINRALLGGLSKPATGPWNSLSEYADPGVEPLAYSPEAGARWLREAGWRDRDGDGILERAGPDGRARAFRFTALYATPAWEKVLTVYQQDLKRAGIAMDLRMVDWSALMKAIEERKFEACLLGYGMSDKIEFNPRPFWHSAFADKGLENATGYRNRRVDELLDRSDRTARREERIAILRQAYRVISEDQPAILLFNQRASYFARSRRLQMERPAYRYLWAIDYWWFGDP